MRKTLYSIALIGAMAFSGCQKEERIIEGKVYDKLHEAERTIIVVTPVDKNETWYSWEEQKKPERFRLRIEMDIDGEKYNSSMDVNKETFDEYEIGDYYPKPKTQIK